MSDPREVLVALILERFRAAETYMDLPRQAGLLADAIQSAGWTPPRSVAELVTGAAHPEDVCHRCGGPNVVRWHAPSEAWNQVEQHEGILCPQCFTSAYEALHPGTAWHVGPEVGGPCRYPLLTNEEPAAPPSVEDVARALFERAVKAGDAIPHRSVFEADARAALALFPGRTESEVKAEALRGAAPGCNCEDDYARLNDRADRIEKEADRG